MVKKVFALLVLTLLICSPAAMARDMSVSLKAGVLGGGVEVGTPITDTIGIRAGFNYLPYDSDGEYDDIDYEYELTMQSASLLMDWHPYGSSFRFSAGALYNGNKFEVTSEPSVTYTVGDTTYTAAQVGTLDGEVDFDSLAPYASMGWDTSFGKNKQWGFIVEVGAVYQGEAEVEMTANGTLATNQAFLADLQKEEDNIQDEIDDYKFLPVVAIGVSYRF